MFGALGTRVPRASDGRSRRRRALESFKVVDLKGLTAALATARYRLGRLQYIGVPREAVVARIQQAQFRAQETAQGRAQRLYEPLPSHADFFGYQALGMAQRAAAVGA